MNKLLKRILVGILLIAVVVAAMFLHPLFLFVLTAVWIFLATLEYTKLLDKQKVHLPLLFLPLVNLLLPVVATLDFTVRHHASRAFQGPALLLPLGIIAAFVLFASPPRGPKLAYGSFGVLYLSLLPVHLLLLKQFTLEHRGLTAFVVLFPLLGTWVSDTAAYGFGRWLGKNKLTEISPNKTWEGLAYGVIFAIAFSVAYLRYFLPAANLLDRTVIGLLLGLAAEAGDLVESIFKREAGVKDSSTALSEHGGFLDRADSLLFTIPVFYYYLTLVIRPA
jgi:phosphatidate cytidylyltransferase